MGVVLDLQPETADIHIHDLQLTKVIPAPYQIQDLLPAECLAGILHKHLHDGIFHLGQLYPLAVFLQSTVAGVEQEGLLMDLPRLFRHCAASPPEQGVHTGRQLRRREGLCHIVISAGHQPCHLIHFLAPGRQHNDPDPGIGGPNPAADLKAVNPRQHDVQEGYSDVRMLLELLQSLLAGFRLDHLIARPGKIDHNKAADTGFILKHQNFSGHFPNLPFPSPP